MTIDTNKLQQGLGAIIAVFRAMVMLLALYIVGLALVDHVLRHFPMAGLDQTQLLYLAGAAAAVSWGCR